MIMTGLVRLVVMQSMTNCHLLPDMWQTGTGGDFIVIRSPPLQGLEGRGAAAALASITRGLVIRPPRAGGEGERGGLSATNYRVNIWTLHMRHSNVNVNKRFKK
jgi:hypothetical protein